MFYAHFILAKKGPLARIWLAAHWDKKLTKAHVFETNIEKSVDGILQPKVKMALRTSGHLLLGVVRIYSRKAKYLLADCNEAFVKIKMAFRPGMVDLPEEHREAAVNAITLPEVFHDFDTAMPELNDVDIEAQFSLNQSRAEEITMREDYGNISLVTNDDGFGDMGFDTDAPDLMRHTAGLEPSMEQSNLLFSDGQGLEGMGLDKDKEPVPSTSAAHSAMEVDAPIRDDGFGGNLDQNIISGGLFEGGLFDDAPMPEMPSVDDAGKLDSPLNSDDDMDHFGGPPSVGGASSDSGGSRPGSPACEAVETAEAPAPADPEPSVPEQAADDNATAGDGLPTDGVLEQTTLLHNEEESFALAPVDASALKGFTKAKRKRKLIVDEVKNISGEEMKNQLSDTSDIVTTLDLAPPTKRLMHWKETGGVEKLFALPARPIPARALFKNYQRHLTSRAFGTEDFAMLGDADVLAPDQAREQDDPPTFTAADQSVTPVAKRITRKRKYPSESGADEPQLVEPAAVIMDPQPEPPPPLVFAEPPTIIEQQQSQQQQPQQTPLPSVVFETPVVPTPLPPLEDIPAHEVRSILQQHEEEDTDDQPDQLDQLQLDPLSHMEMANMGYDEHASHGAGAMSERVATPFHEDYDFPQAEGSPAEEQLVDETDEQYEERVLNKRAYHVFTGVKSRLQRCEHLFLSDMSLRSSRKQVAQRFYSLLVLKKFQALELQQDAPYDDIFITRGSKFENPTL